MLAEEDYVNFMTLGFIT